MNELPAWVNITSALLAPTIAIVALFLGVLNYRLSARRRRDDLFDRRYRFYQQVRDAWLSTADPSTRPPDIEDWIPIAEEASFLFGSDIADHLVSLDGRKHSGSPFFPNDNFVEPFRKYLTLA